MFAINSVGRKKNYAEFKNTEIDDSGKPYKGVLFQKVYKHTWYKLRTLRNIYAESNSDMLDKALNAFCRLNNIDPKTIETRKSATNEVSLKDLPTSTLQSIHSTHKEPIEDIGRPLDNGKASEHGQALEYGKTKDYGETKECGQTKEYGQTKEFGQTIPTQTKVIDNVP